MTAYLTGSNLRETGAGGVGEWLPNWVQCNQGRESTAPANLHDSSVVWYLRDHVPLEQEARE